MFRSDLLRDNSTASSAWKLPATASTSVLASTGPATKAQVPEPRLVKAAHEFEAAMMKELMAPLASGRDGLGEDDETDGSGSALTSFADEALGKAISEHGGFGIANSIIHQLSAHGNHNGKSSVPIAANRDTLKSPLK